MKNMLVKSMHVLVLLSMALILVISAGYYFDSHNYAYGGGELGNSLLYALLYFCALVIGFIGWILSIVLLAKERHRRTKQSKYAAMYVLLGIVGFSLAYYFIQAS